MIGPLNSEEDFIEEDFNLLERFMMSSATGRIEKKIKSLTLDSRRYGTVVSPFKQLSLFCNGRVVVLSMLSV